MKSVLKILLFPVVLLLDVFIWICCGLLACSAFVFSLLSSLLSLLAFLVMLSGSVSNGFIILLLAFLISPMGLPLVATRLLAGLQHITAAIKYL